MTPIIGVFPSANFPQESIFPQAITFSPRIQFSLLGYKVLFCDLVNTPLPSPKDRLQSQLRCTFSLLNKSHPSLKFAENCHWLADFISYLHSCVEFSEHTGGIIQITLDPSVWYSALSSLWKCDNQKCLLALNFAEVSLFTKKNVP